MGEPRTASGRCMCGAVRFVASDVPDTFSICHCEMCRQWTGLALAGVSIAKGSVEWQGKENIEEIHSSAWAKRGFCRRCGSGLYFQFTAEGRWAEEVEIPIGLFDNPNGFRLRSEIWVDEKPDSYDFVDQGHKRLTRADVIRVLPIIGKE